MLLTLTDKIYLILDLCALPRAFVVMVVCVLMAVCVIVVVLVCVCGCVRMFVNNSHGEPFIEF